MRMQQFYLLFIFLLLLLRLQEAWGSFLLAENFIVKSIARLLCKTKTLNPRP